ncbi:phage major capsid family protein [Arthrobacter sp. Hz1]
MIQTEPLSFVLLKGVRDASPHYLHTELIASKQCMLGQQIHDEMVYGFLRALDEMVLNDTIDENGEILNGLLTATRVGGTAFFGDTVRTVRRALGSQEGQGIEPTHVTMNPTDLEPLETMQLSDGSYLLPDRPGDSGARRIWTAPVLLVAGLAPGTAVVGDFTTGSIGIASRGTIHPQWNPFSKDTTNETI